MNDAGIGARTAEARKLAGLNQRQLAERTNVSLSLLRKVEQGDRAASPAFVAAVARALGVDIGKLHGQPYPATSRAEAAVHAAIPELRRAVMAFDDDDVLGAPPTLDQLTAQLDRIRELGRRARFGESTALLPEVLRGLHRLAEDESPGHEREQIYVTLAYAYSKAMLSAYQYGYLDLAGLAAERCCWAAARCGDPVWAIAAEYNRALILLYSGAYSTGLRVIDRAYSASEELPESPNLLAVRGALHLRGSVLSARATNAATADAHLEGAYEIARRLNGTRYDHYGTGFRSSNVDIHSVSVPVELSDGTTAVTRAEQIQLPRSAAASRVGHHHIDLGRAWLLHGNPARALASLQEARRIAPELTRYHPMVHETLRVLARARRGTDQLASFAQWANVKL